MKPVFIGAVDVQDVTFPGKSLDLRNLATYAQGSSQGVVMPQGENSYFVNAALRPADRYPDYMVDDLPSDLEAHYRAAPTNTAIAGVSMGGFGPLNLGLQHADQYWLLDRQQYGGRSESEIRLAEIRAVVALA